LLALPANDLAAQATLTIRLPVKDVMSLDASSTTVTFPTPDAAAYDGTTLPVSSGLSLTVRSNRQWKVTLSSAATFGFTNSGANTFSAPAKPASDVQWSTVASPFAVNGTLGVTGGSVSFTGTGLSGTSTAYQPVGLATTTVYFRSAWSYVRDVPGTYTLQINVTLSTP
jgi:hypothetical protein